MVSDHFEQGLLCPCGLPLGLLDLHDDLLQLEVALPSLLLHQLPLFQLPVELALEALDHLVADALLLLKLRELLTAFPEEVLLGLRFRVQGLQLDAC